jgi:flotillin
MPAQLPELVEAAARGIAGSNLTVLNGAAGVNEMLAGLVGQGLAVLELLRASTSAASAGSPAQAAPVGTSLTDHSGSRR